MDLVRLCISAEDGDEVQISAFVVPVICDRLQGQSNPQAEDTNLLMTALVMMMLWWILYWQLVTGRVVLGEHGPTAIQTKLGWVLSGPLH